MSSFFDIISVFFNTMSTLRRNMTESKKNAGVSKLKFKNLIDLNLKLKNLLNIFSKKLNDSRAWLEILFLPIF